MTPRSPPANRRDFDLRVSSSDQLAEGLGTRPRQPNRGLLLEIITDVASGSASAAEVRYLRRVERAHGLPAGRRQAPDGHGRRRDIEYEDYGLVVEIDGRLNHDSWAARRRDAIKDRAAAVTGRVGVHCYWTDLVPSACALALDVAAILRIRGWAGEASACGPRCPATCGTSVGSRGAWTST